MLEDVNKSLVHNVENWNRKTMATLERYRRRKYYVKNWNFLHNMMKHK